jgi:Spy/CpxP family protein refolding chaperone
MRFRGIILAVLLALASMAAWARAHRNDGTGASAAASGVALVLELADELRLTQAQREEVEQLEDEQRRRHFSEQAAERRLRALLTEHQMMRYERLRAQRTN